MLLLFKGKEQKRRFFQFYSYFYNFIKTIYLLMLFFKQLFIFLTVDTELQLI